ncbi:MAG TPA: PLP-dependent cysteine synthase family protein [Candidatus Binataceae bacterium]
MPAARADNVLELVGNTPLLEIRRLTAGLIRPGVKIFAKLEGFNPGGSVKDRPAKKMIEVGLASGALKPGKVILDSTSGNTGIALAMVGAIVGYPVELVMASNVSRERKKIIEAYGAKPIYSDPMEGSDGAIRKCRELIAENPERYFKPDQYNNEANSLSHFETTGPEIWRQTRGQVTHFVAGIGTGGTIMGAGRYLKSQNSAVKVVAVEPDDELHGLEGLKHMASSIVPGIYHEQELDEKISVATEEAYEMVYALGQSEGILIGQSAGAAMIAALRIARTLRKGCVVTVFADFGEKYLSTNLWIGWQEWRRERLAQVISKWRKE